ncbi:MAG: hypothetical protein ACFFDT_23745 [Candidatus Hodarchaeota archaeon]
MEIKSPKSIIKLAKLLVSALFFVFAFYDTASSKIEPTGTNIGVVQFDAVIELNRYSPDSSQRHYYTIIFARYWVSRDYYSLAIVWAEPQSTDLYFAVLPAGLSVYSDKQSFDIVHEAYPKYNNTYIKPLGERGVFRYKFGSYPVGNIRFADQEAAATRIYASDLKVLNDANEADVQVSDVSIPAMEGGQTRDVYQLKVQKNGERIESMKLLNAEQQLLKDITYEYDCMGGKTYLRRQIVVLPERPMMVGFKGEGIKVTLDGKEYKYRDIQATHHNGSRTCTVEYKTVTLGDKKVPLPVKLTVRGEKDKRILRCIRMMNFKKVELDAAGAKQAAEQFCGFTPEQRHYREFRSRYWQKNPDEVENIDAEAIKQLRVHFEKEVDLTDNSVGEKIKYLNKPN